MFVHLFGHLKQADECVFLLDKLLFHQVEAILPLKVLRVTACQIPDQFLLQHVPCADRKLIPRVFVTQNSAGYKWNAGFAYV